MNEREYMMFAFLGLSFLTQDENFQFHLFTCKFHNFSFSATLTFVAALFTSAKKQNLADVDWLISIPTFFVI